MKPARILAATTAGAILLIWAWASVAHADPIRDAWKRTRPDLRTHATVSAELAGVAAWPMAGSMFDRTRPQMRPWQRFAIPFAFAMSAGVAKEALDETEFRTGWPARHPGQGADPMDLAADVAGSAAGAAMAAAVCSGVAVVVTPRSALLAVRF